MLEGAGFEDVRLVPLPADAAAKGPALFVAAGRTQQRRYEVTRTRKIVPREVVVFR
jgi:hypothetical protein